MTTNMRRDINELKHAVESTNSAVASTIAALERTNLVAERTNSMLNRTMISVAQLVGSMADMKQYLAENMATKKDMSGLNARIDGFSGLLLDSRHRWAVHADTLSDHDERIKRLEAPGA